MQLARLEVLAVHSGFAPLTPQSTSLTTGLPSYRNDDMPRTARAIEADLVYHVLNRGNAGMPILEDPTEVWNDTDDCAELLNDREVGTGLVWVGGLSDPG